MFIAPQIVYGVSPQSTKSRIHTGYKVLCYLNKRIFTSFKQDLVWPDDLFIYLFVSLTSKL